MSPVAIELASAPTSDVHALVGELEAELASEYPDEQRHGLDVPALFSPHVRFFVAKASGEAVGCGGVAIFPGYAEAKRMYVRPSARGRGIADAVLARLEEETLDAATWGAELSFRLLRAGERLRQIRTIVEAAMVPVEAVPCADSQDRATFKLPATLRQGTLGTRQSDRSGEQGRDWDDLQADEIGLVGESIVDLSLPV